MVLLRCSGLTRAPWFQGCDLAVERGEIVVLRGPSGSGKSLLLRAIADLDPVDAGSVSLDGRDRDAGSAPAWRARVLYVHPGGVHLAEDVAADLGAVAHLGHAAGRLPGAVDGLPMPDRSARTARLSSGEGQMLALARALGAGAEVLLLDEPTSAMDPAAAGAWERALRGWADAGRGIVWISHDASLAHRVGARAASIDTWRRSAP